MLRQIHPVPLQAPPWMAPADASPPAEPAGWRGQRSERAFVALLGALRGCGGAVSGDQLASLLRHHHAQPISVVAKWLVRRSILSFCWRGQTFIPLFQFDREQLAPRPELASVLCELADAFDDWEQVAWFAQPNSWLGDQAPALCLATRLADVQRAARADRYIARG